MTPLLALQTAMYETLTGLGYIVFDYRPMEEPFPYMVIGEDDLSSSHLKDKPHYTVISTVNVFSKYEGNKQVKEMLDAFISNCDRHMSLTGWKISHMEVLNTDILPDTQPDVIHGIAVVEYQISKL